MSKSHQFINSKLHDLIMEFFEDYCDRFDIWRDKDSDGDQIVRIYIKLRESKHLTSLKLIDFKSKARELLLKNGVEDLLIISFDY